MGHFCVLFFFVLTKTAPTNRRVPQILAKMPGLTQQARESADRYGGLCARHRNEQDMCGDRNEQVFLDVGWNVGMSTIPIYIHIEETRN